MTTAHHDFETRSAADLKKVGLYRYFEHSTTSVLCMSWRVGSEGPVNRWRPGDEDPYALLEHIANGGTLTAHNAAFERRAWRWLRENGHADWPSLSAEQQDCTMARAAALALPQSLDQLGKALKTTIQKDDVGHRLMMQMCKPRKVEADGSIVWWDAPEKLERLAEYCDNDVETETAIDAMLPFLSDTERRAWLLDQKINERGVRLDVHTISRAIEVVSEAQQRADDRMWWLTDGDVKKCTETAKLVAWLNSRGVPCTSIAKGEVDEIVQSTMVLGDALAQEAIELRSAAAKSSTAKFKKMLETVQADGRARGLLNYHGASTGRWAGRLWQPQNLPRVDADRDLPDVLRAVELLNTNKGKKDLIDSIELVTGKPMETLSKCLRAMLIASPGKKFVGGDFSNIEGRVNAWLAGETWKVEAFRQFDQGVGHDLYKVGYAASFGLDPANVTKAQRQIGKVQELALGYQGSVGAYITMGAVYGIRPAEVAEVAAATTDQNDWLLTRSKFTETSSYGLDVDVWTGIKSVVNAWRAAHPNIVQGWWDLQDAAIEAVSMPGLVVPCFGGKVKYLAKNGFLFCALPSGRVIAYASPRVAGVEQDFGNGPQRRNQVQYEGVDSKTRRWGKQALYGGKQCENIVQAIARDVMLEAMFRAEDEDFPILLTVHDELLTEVSDTSGPLDDDALTLKRIMEHLPTWAEGLPIAASTWEDQRYVK